MYEGYDVADNDLKYHGSVAFSVPFYNTTDKKHLRKDIPVL